MPRKQIWSGIALAAAAASSLTGCSLKASDGTPKSMAQLSSLSAHDAIQAATRAVTAHPSAKVHTVLNSPSGSESFDLSATFDEHPKFAGTLGAGDPSQSSSPGVPIQFASDVMYMKMGIIPSMAAQMNGKPWLKVDMAAAAEDPQTSTFGAEVMDNASPAKGLTLLTAAKDLHKVGEEQKGGTQTVHYAGTVTGADSLDPNLIGRGLTQDDMDVVGKALAHGMIDKVGYDLWLRADGLPVAMTFSASTANASLNGEIDYTDWGTAVSVDAIPDSQVADYLEMVKKAKAAQGGTTPDASGPAGSASEPGASSSSGAPGTPDTSSTPSGSDSAGAPGSASSGAPSTPSSPAPTGASNTAGVPATPGPTGASSTGASNSAGSSSASKPSNTSTSSSSGR